MFVVMGFSLILLVLGMGVALRPAESVNLILMHKESITLYLTSIVSRLVLGGVLIHYAALSDLPGFIMLVGWLIMAVALGIAFLGRAQFAKVIGWLAVRFGYCVRYAGLALVFFSVFLIISFY